MSSWLHIPIALPIIVGVATAVIIPPLVLAIRKMNIQGRENWVRFTFIPTKFYLMGSLSVCGAGYYFKTNSESSMNNIFDSYQIFLTLYIASILISMLSVVDVYRQYWSGKLAKVVAYGIGVEFVGASLLMIASFYLSMRVW